MCESYHRFHLRLHTDTFFDRSNNSVEHFASKNSNVTTAYCTVIDVDNDM